MRLPSPTEPVHGMGVLPVWRAPVSRTSEQGTSQGGVVERPSWMQQHRMQGAAGLPSAFQARGLQLERHSVSVAVVAHMLAAQVHNCVKIVILLPSN
jgi:hypothetical protein